jgi:hypothetical protein
MRLRGGSHFRLSPSRPRLDVIASFSSRGPSGCDVPAPMRIKPEVDAIKEILMAMARDGGALGEDNNNGWGTIDAYAAVAQAVPPAAVDKGADGATRSCRRVLCLLGIRGKIRPHGDAPASMRPVSQD